jgi:hypothetical protein
MNKWDKYKILVLKKNLKMKVPKEEKVHKNTL